MIQGFDEHNGSSPLDELRDELGEDLLRAARREPRARRRRRLRGAAVAVASVLVIVPAALAIEGTSDEREAIPAPPPALSPESDCPANVREFLRELMADPSLLRQYSDLRGYPVAGCPTLEELEALFEERSRSAPPGAGSIELSPPHSAPGGSGGD